MINIEDVKTISLKHNNRITEVFNDGQQAYYKVRMSFNHLSKRDRLDELASRAGLGHYMTIREFPELLERFAKLVSDPLEYKIDELMLEYCPDEMSKEQLENWSKHQIPVDKE